MLNWLAMGGYANYVWPAYVLACLGLGLPWWLARRRLARTLTAMKAANAS